MSNTPSPPASPLWRQNPLASRSLKRQSDRRRWLIFLLLASVLAFAGILVGLLSWLRPIPRPVFLPIWVSSYQSRQLHFLPWAEQDFRALTRGGYFSRWLVPPSESQGQRNIRQGLGLLAGLLPTDSLVVYVNARACVGPGRELALLPADADPAAPRTWITLREILEALKSSPAARKFLVLDLSKSSVEPRGAMLGEDVAARIPEALRAVPDPARLTLTASSPGQTSLVSDELGRSVFSYYFEEALRGWTELDQPQRHRDGLVQVRDLARYVRTRVNRWARGNKGARQEPVLLGQGEDFPLLALKQGKMQPEPPLPPTRSYPAWLRQGWEMRDRWKADSSVQAAPLAFRQLQLTLLLADAQWRGGVDPDRILQDQMANLGLYQQWLESVQSVRQPRPASLAQAAAQGWTQDPTVVSALNAELNPPPAGENAEATQSNAGAGANANSNATTKTEPAAPQGQGQAVKPASPGGGTAKTNSKSVPAPPVPAPPTAESFQQKTQGASTLDLAGAFFDAARRLDPTAENLIKLDNLLKVQQPEPLYSETLLLRQLAERARASKPEDWPTEVVQRALRVASLAEQANGSSETLAWLRLPLEEAGQIRHNARVILLAQGFASPREADRLYRIAEAQYALILDQQQAILEARKLWLNALECLPFLLDNVFSLPFRAGQDPWSVAASQTLDLQNALRLPPEVKRGEKLLSSAEIRQQVAALRALTASLRLAIDDLCRPFQTPAVNALLKQARMPRVGPEVDLAIERALWTPMPSASQRADLWKADSDLTRRRLKANLQQDRSGQAPPDPSAVESQGSHEAHYRILAARARRRILLLRLAGLSDAKARPLLDQVDQMLKQPGSSGDADHSRSWWNLELALHTTWEGGQERPDAPSKGLQKGEPLNPLVAPPWSLSFISAAPKGEIYEFWLRERENWLAWLANQYEYEGADLTGTPFFRTAARELRALTGGDNRARIASPWKPTRSAPTVSLSNEAPIANDSLAIQIPATTQSNPIPIQVLLHDTTWLRVGPATTQLRRQVEQGETEEGSEGRAYSLFPSGQSLQQAVPLRIELNRAAEEMDGPPPRGFLVRARVAGRDFHQAVGVSLKQASERLQILLSANPSQPTYPQVDLGLRAIKERQSFYLYLRNPTGTSWDVQVGLAVGTSRCRARPLA